MHIASFSGNFAHFFLQNFILLLQSVNFLIEVDNLLIFFVYDIQIVIFIHIDIADRIDVIDLIDIKMIDIIGEVVLLFCGEIDRQTARQVTGVMRVQVAGKVTG